jgi:23S rRNA (uracil1939-C5)-methyltransferase
MLRCNQAGEVSGDLFVNGRPHPPMKPLSDSLLGYRYTYSPNGFFQINLPVYEMALCQIRDYLAQIDTRKVVDMYSGVGTIGLSVARDRNLTLVEVNGDAYNEMLNNIPKGAVNIMPIHTKSEEALEYITGDATIIVDPPRAGLDEKVVSRMLEALPPYIIYLSCNPATQARDVTKLTTKYEISENQPYNFFPRTPHIESLLLLNRR